MSEVIKNEENVETPAFTREEFMVEAANVTKYLSRVQNLTDKAKQVKALSRGKLGHATRTNLNAINRSIDIWISRISESEKKLGMKYQDIMKMYEEILEDAKKAIERVTSAAEKAKTEDSESNKKDSTEETPKTAKKTTKKSTKKSAKKSTKTKE